VIVKFDMFIYLCSGHGNIKMRSQGLEKQSYSKVKSLLGDGNPGFLETAVR
jgi:hypothetical protein